MKVLKDPVDLEHANRQIIIKDLTDIYNSVEKLIQRTYMKKETDLNFQLRNIRTSVSQLLSDIKNRNLDGFYGRKGNLDDFYRTEGKLLDEAARMNDTFSSLTFSTGSLDIFMLENQLDSFKKTFDDRITINKDLLKEFSLQQMEANSAERVMSGEKHILFKKEQQTQTAFGISKSEKLSDTSNASRSVFVPTRDPERTVWNDTDKSNKEDIETNTLSKLYNYMNVLEHKYSTYQPELSFNGEYVGDRKWKMNISERAISGIIMDGVIKPLLTFETYWHPFDDQRTIMNFVQKEANAVPSGQSKSLCLLNSGWSTDIRNWSQNYIHPRLVIYLYDLETDEILFNTSAKNAGRLKIWHDNEPYIILEMEIAHLIDQDETFEISDVCEITGLSTDGARKFLSSMISENKIIDVGFGTPLYAGMKRE